MRNKANQKSITIYNIVEEVSEEMNLDKKVMTKFIFRVFEKIKENLSINNRVQVRGCFTFLMAKHKKKQNNLKKTETVPERLIPKVVFMSNFLKQCRKDID